MPGGRVSFRGELRGVKPETKADGNGMARADVIIENGTVVGEGGVFSADVVIADERIAALTLDASDWSASTCTPTLKSPIHCCSKDSGPAVWPRPLAD
jgi:hypothetical protein